MTDSTTTTTTTRPGLLGRVARGLLALGASIPFACWSAYAY